MSLTPEHKLCKICQSAKSELSYPEAEEIARQALALPTTDQVAGFWQDTLRVCGCPFGAAG